MESLVLYSVDGICIDIKLLAVLVGMLFRYETNVYKGVLLRVVISLECCW